MSNNERRDANLMEIDGKPELEIAQLIDIKKIQEIMDRFYALTEIGVAVVDMEGNVLVATGWQKICTQFHRINPESCKNCIESDIYLSKDTKKGDFLIYKCKNNLWDMASPIIIENMRIGTIFLGQFFFDDETIEEGKFIEQAKKYGFDREKYINALREVPIWSREKVYSAMRFYTKIAEIISDLGYANYKKAKLVKKIQNSEEELKKSEERFREIVHRSPVGIGIVNSDGMLVDVNEALCGIVGYSKEELLSISFEEFTHKKDLEKEWVLIDEMWRGERKSYRMIKRYIHKDGVYVWVDVAASLIREPNGDPKLGFAFVQDITERIKNERKLENAREKSEFYRDLLAHDMGNILNNIKSSVQLIQDVSYNKLENVNTEELMALINQQVQRGASLISNVRKLALFEEKHDITKPVLFLQILKTVLENVKSRFNDITINLINLTEDQNPSIEAGDLLIDAIENLLLNAIIHNKSNKICIEIILSEIEKDDGVYVKTEFKDNAVGISDERKMRIFDRGVKKDKYTGGMGIGLSLVKKIIDSYKGKIWVENRIDGDYTQGSNFVVLLRKV